MEKIPYSESEQEVIKEVPSLFGVTRIYNRPITERENMRLLYTEDHPMWIPSGRGANASFSPAVIPDNSARP